MSDSPGIADELSASSRYQDLGSRACLRYFAIIGRLLFGPGAPSPSGRVADRRFAVPPCRQRGALAVPSQPGRLPIGLWVLALPSPAPQIYRQDEEKCWAPPGTLADRAGRKRDRKIERKTSAELQV